MVMNWNQERRKAKSKRMVESLSRALGRHLLSRDQAASTGKLVSMPCHRLAKDNARCIAGHDRKDALVSGTRGFVGYTSDRQTADLKGGAASDNSATAGRLIAYHNP